MTNALQDQELQELTKFGTSFCHTVILYGSRARGTHEPNSDYDLLLVREGSGEEDYKATTSAGLPLDVYMYGELEFTSEHANEQILRVIRIRDGIIIRDDKGFGARLIQQVRETFDRGCPPLSPKEAVSRRLWIKDMLRRISHGQEQVLADYRRVFLLKELLEMHFALRSRWFLGERESFKWLAENEPRTYDSFTVALAPGASLEAIEQLARLVSTETGRSKARDAPQQ